MYELRKHAIRPTFVDLTQSTEDGQLIIRHAHVSLQPSLTRSRRSRSTTHLVCLDISLRDGLQFSRRNCVKEPGQVCQKASIKSIVETSYSCKTGSSNAFCAYAMNFFKSTLLIAPIGLISAARVSAISEVKITNAYLKNSHTW